MKATLVHAAVLLGLTAMLGAAAAETPAAGDKTRYLQTLTPPAPHPAAAPFDPGAERFARQLAERYGVRVLRAKRTEENGRAVYRLVVMMPGGDLDNAYAVRTLIVDADSGELVPQFRHEASGYALAAPADRRPRDDGVATTLRRESFTAR